MKTGLKDTDKGFKRLMKIAKLGGASVRVGVLSGEGHDGITMAELASIHEFGAPAANIPERSFLRATADLNRNEWGAFLEQRFIAVTQGKMKIEGALAFMGERAVADVQKRIRSAQGIPPPLKNATVAAKGSSRPLVDSGRLVQSISYQVESRQK